MAIAGAPGVLPGVLPASLKVTAAAPLPGRLVPWREGAAVSQEQEQRERSSAGAASTPSSKSKGGFVRLLVHSCVGLFNISNPRGQRGQERSRQQ